MTDNFRESSLRENIAKFDPYAHAVTVIQEQHRLSHDGFMFHSSGKVLGLANAGVADFLMVVPAGTFPHVQRVRLDLSRGDIDMTLHEGVTTSNDGTPISVFNTNRNSSNLPAATSYSAPTVTDTGLLIHTHFAPPTGTGVGSAAGIVDVEQGEEWLFKPATKYLFRITNNSGGSIDYRYEFLFYEVGYDHAGQ